MAPKNPPIEAACALIFVKKFTSKRIQITVTEERIKVINNLHKEEASVTVEDKMSEIGNPMGTKVIVVIPF